MKNIDDGASLSWTTKTLQYLAEWLRDLAGPLLMAGVLSLFISNRMGLGFWTTFLIAVLAIFAVAWISSRVDKD